MSEQYQLFLSRSAEKDLRGLPKSDRQRVGAAIRALADNPRPKGCQKLVVEKGTGFVLASTALPMMWMTMQKEVRVYRILYRKDAYRF